MTTSVVLRDRQRIAGPFSGPRAFGRETRAFAFSEPLIEVEDVDSKGKAELLRDPEVVAVTPAMPTRLIEPLAEEGPSGDEAWGIGAVGADRSPFTGADPRRSGTQVRRQSLRPNSASGFEPLTTRYVGSSRSAFESNSGRWCVGGSGTSSRSAGAPATDLGACRSIRPGDREVWGYGDCVEGWG